MVVQGDEVAGGSADGRLWLGGLGLSGLPSLAKCSYLLCWTSREKSTMEEEIKEKEENIRERSSEVQVRSLFTGSFRAEEQV